MMKLIYWGAVEGRQVNGTRGVEPNEKTYDSVPSGRNHGYFLRTLAARRALTFLEQQPEVDGSNLGVDGHSMGGVITLQTAAMDPRVKAAAPSCAPPLNFEDTLQARTASPGAYAKRIKGKILFMSPSNDFHGMAESVEWIISHMPSKDFRIARSMHLNHKHDSNSLAAKQLWFDAHLKGRFSYPAQPEISVDLKAPDGRARVSITPDSSIPIAGVDIFYTRDAKHAENATNRTRFWHCARPVEKGGSYSASLDLFDLDEPLWVFANIQYKLDQPAEAYALTRTTDTFTVTSRMKMFSPEQLRQSGVTADGETTTLIEAFEADWEKEWVVSDNKWESWRLNDPRVPMPAYGKLVLELQCDQANHLTTIIGDHRKVFPIKGGAGSERIEIYPFDLKHKTTKAALLNWQHLVRPMLTLSSSRAKAQPVFNKLYWEDISVDEFMAKRPFQLGDAEKKDGKVMLTFGHADQIVGRYDPDMKSVKLDKSLADKTYDQGMQVHSHSELTYFTKGAFSTFRTKLVACYQASVTFEVHGDGKKLFDSGRFGGKSTPKDIEVDISGAQELKLVVTDGGNGWGGDWVTWANAVCE